MPLVASLRRHIVLAAVPVGLIFPVACGDDDSDVVDHHSGADGAASSGGKVGSGGAGDASGGADSSGGRSASGGRSGKGGAGGSGGKGSGGKGSGGKGSGGKGSGGKGSGGKGSGGTSMEDDAGTDAGDGSLTPMCGNGIVEGAERCDEGAQNGGALCSETCTLVACDTCREEHCPDFESDDCGGYVGEEDDPAGQADCSSVLTCVRDTDCSVAESSATSPFDPRLCYCGTADLAGCFSDTAPADGACKDIIEDIAEPLNQIEMGTKILSTTNPVGYAIQSLICEYRECQSECYEAAAGGDAGVQDAGGSPDAAIGDASE